MPTEEIEVTISPEGEVSIKVRGINGTRCLAATADLERLLGGEVVKREMTSEAYPSQRDMQQTSDWNRAGS
jgi:hypothetical protein